MGDNWGGDIVMDFAASPNSEGSGKGDQVFIEGASVWYKYSDALRIDIGQKKVPFGIEETTSSSKLKAIERSAVNRQFAESSQIQCTTYRFVCQRQSYRSVFL